MKLWSNPQGWLTIHYFFFAESKIPSERKRFCSRQPTWLVSCNETRNFENALIWKYPIKKDKLRKFLFFWKKKLDFLSWNSLHGKVGVDRSGMEEEKPGRTFSPSPPLPLPQFFRLSPRYVQSSTCTALQNVFAGSLLRAAETWVHGDKKGQFTWRTLHETPFPRAVVWRRCSHLSIWSRCRCLRFGDRLLQGKKTFLNMSLSLTQ